MKFALSSLVASLALSLPALAQAQELGSKGDFVISADRMLGITGTKRNVDAPFGDNNSFTSISFGWRASPDESPFDVPRVSFDYLIIDHLSLGGSIGFFSIDPDNGPTYSAWTFAPRVGYLYSFSKVFGIWPRGGFTYHRLDAGDNRTDKGFALSFECPFTLSPTPHFAITVGPSFDIDMFGDRTVRAGNISSSGDLTWRAFGLNAGILGWI